jgi:HAD superfamily phosphoserine phosphatase-like hydrolase
MKKNGYRIIVISASLECWLKPWCDLHNVELLSTKLKFKNSKVIGEFLTPNCYGKEKVNRLKNYLNIDEYDEIISFGDSKADKYIFDISDKWFLIK